MRVDRDFLRPLLLLVLLPVTLRAVVLRRALLVPVLLLMVVVVAVGVLLQLDLHHPSHIHDTAAANATATAAGRVVGAEVVWLWLVVLLERFMHHPSHVVGAAAAAITARAVVRAVGMVDVLRAVVLLPLVLEVAPALSHQEQRKTSPASPAGCCRRVVAWMARILALGMRKPRRSRSMDSGSCGLLERRLVLRLRLTFTKPRRSSLEGLGLTGGLLNLRFTSPSPSHGGPRSKG